MSAPMLIASLLSLLTLLVGVLVWALKAPADKPYTPEALIRWHTRPMTTSPAVASPDPRDALVAGYAKLQKRA